MPSGRSTAEILGRFAAHGVLGSDRASHHIRFVTHRHHTPAVIDEALRRIAAAMAELA